MSNISKGEDMQNFPNFDYEQELYARGMRCVAGVDEAGRGPLAGDVYAAAVILPRDFAPRGINDSKKLSPQKREELYDYIIETCVAFGISRATAAEIDEINIRNAAFLAMRRAIENLTIKPDFLLVDGNAFNDCGIPFTTITKGDCKSLSIAAASIVAKVSRDRAMVALDEAHPEYGFARHKGYPTKEHYAAILAHGVLAEHRKSFRLGVN